MHRLRVVDVETYASLKGLDVAELKSWGVGERGGALTIPYLTADGERMAVRYRGDGTPKFWFRDRDKPCLYGLWRLEDGPFMFLVEGESCAHTLWHHGIPAVGVPGAGNWRDDRDAAHLEGFERVMVVREPDQGGDRLVASMSRSRLRDRVLIVTLDGFDDVSATHLDDPERFQSRLKAAVDHGVTFAELDAEASDREARESWDACSVLAAEEDVLEVFLGDLRRAGVVGEERLAGAVFLALTSRLLDRPVSIIAKGLSAAGKSFTVSTTAKFFPDDAVLTFTTASARALIYTEENFSHRHLFLQEANPVQDGGDLAHLLRVLVSEGKLSHRTVIDFSEVAIEKEGPTGLLLTTTATNLDEELETRCLSFTVDDSEEQTARILLEHARQSDRSAVDFGRWHALQVWLASGERRVVVPFEEELSERVAPVAVVLRRAVPLVVELVRAHALLHRHRRDTDASGRVVATLDDYRAVRRLVAESVAEMVDAHVTESVRAVVDGVSARWERNGEKPVTIRQLTEQLGRHRSTIFREAKKAIRDGYLWNHAYSGQTLRLAPGDSLPGEQVILPEADDLPCAMLHGSEGERVRIHIPEHR